MPRVFSPRPKPRRHAFARARWLGGHTLPASALPLAERNQTFAQLQSLLSHPAHADLSLPVARLAQLFADMDETMTESSQTLARADNRLHSLLDMLRLADNTALPARQLLSLLIPLHQQLLLAQHQLTELQ